MESQAQLWRVRQGLYEEARREVPLTWARMESDCETAGSVLAPISHTCSRRWPSISEAFWRLPSVRSTSLGCLPLWSL